MKVVFRTDASLQIGSGHVMRCLTLADALRDRGAHCHFISREHPGHLFDRIRQRGHDLRVLAAVPDQRSAAQDAKLPTHAEWLGCDWKVDAAQTKLAMASDTDWLVVDHYALDGRWEQSLAGSFRKLLVIDDLADRSHDCDVLLDQTFQRSAAVYRGLLPSACKVLAGTGFALLRPEFAALRESSQRRRRGGELRHLLVTMGGVDRDDATGRVLAALGGIALPPECRITVVMGAAAPHAHAIRAQAASLRWPTQVRTDVDDLAQLMADADLGIGAAGGTALERCCLGLPAILLVLADNQRKLATNLQGVGAATVIDARDPLAFRLAREIGRLAGDPAALCDMGLAASKVTDGHGVDAVIAELEALRG
jgi:UDP-2,4-diacetamido-2,4,6-trideoxy-beta-L-altropyranose hydrolase